MQYFNLRWLAVYGYLLAVLIATPYLPQLIEWASSRWPETSIPGFVFGVEVSTGVLLIISVVVIFFFNGRKFPLFLLLIGGFITFGSLFYFLIPNPYELTHLPEYAILGVLVLHALKGQGVEKTGKLKDGFFYLRSAMITGAAGTADELYQGILPLRYFAWYDVFLNVVGGLLGLTVFWAFSKE